jgi:hypothetical protein
MAPSGKRLAASRGARAGAREEPCQTGPKIRQHCSTKRNSVEAVTTLLKSKLMTYSTFIGAVTIIGIIC